MPESPPPTGSPRPPRWHPFNVTLWGIPEMRMFPTVTQRQRALHEIGIESSNIASGGFWFGVFACAAMLVVCVTAVRWGLDRVTWPRIVEVPLYYGSLLFVVYATLNLLHRHGAVADLRAKLLACGVPVCRGCGYLLKGLPLDPGRCPECGRGFDDDVRAILSTPPPS